VNEKAHDSNLVVDLDRKWSNSGAQSGCRRQLANTKLFRCHGRRMAETRVELYRQVRQFSSVTATVEQTQHELARLIRLVVGGQEILITEGGQPVAKLIGVTPQGVTMDRAQWLKSLRELRENMSTGKGGPASEEILAQDRAGRE
jgi:antitoxin (DNA-binding transcriptional repressor) of toxin-antitoxin stability system